MGRISWCGLLVNYREWNDFIQKEVAAQLHVSREYYSKLERGKAKPSGEIIERILDITGAEIVYRPKNKKANDVCKACSLLTAENKELVSGMILRLSSLITLLIVIPG